MQSSEFVGGCTDGFALSSGSRNINQTKVVRTITVNIMLCMKNMSNIIIMYLRPIGRRNLVAVLCRENMSNVATISLLRPRGRRCVVLCRENIHEVASK